MRLVDVDAVPEFQFELGVAGGELRGDRDDGGVERPVELERLREPASVVHAPGEHLELFAIIAPGRAEPRPGNQDVRTRGQAVLDRRVRHDGRGDDDAVDDGGRPVGLECPQHRLDAPARARVRHLRLARDAVGVDEDGVDVRSPRVDTEYHVSG